MDNKGNGMRAFGVLAALGTVIAAVVATVRPMAQQIEFQEREVAEIRRLVAEHERLSEHKGAGEAIASIRVLFQEVETQFKGTREIVGVHVDTIQSMVDDIQDRQDRLDERLRHLEIASGGQ